MPVFNFATPTVAFKPLLGEVVGVDPYDDSTDATYIRARYDNGNFCHVNAEFAPMTFTEIPEITVRATGVPDSGDGFTRMVMNLYPPGGPNYATGLVEPVLNLSAGPSVVYVRVPNTGDITDGAVTITDWNTNLPATLAQINAYFAGGGCLLIQPDVQGNTAPTFAANLYVYRISIGGELTDEAVAHRRNFPRDDVRRNFPPSRAIQGGRRTSGGYL